MFVAARQVFNDTQLYGHSLTTFPGKVWESVAKGKLFTYHTPDPEFPLPFKKGFLYEEYMKVLSRHPSGNLKKVESFMNFLPLKYLELGVRHVIGGVGSVGLASVLYPLGFAVKLIHFLGQRLGQYFSRGWTPTELTTQEQQTLNSAKQANPEGNYRVTRFFLGFRVELIPNEGAG